MSLAKRSLRDLGWKDYFRQAFAWLEADGHAPARVMLQEAVTLQPRR